MTFFFEGLFLGCAYAMPIGSQNIFVIQSALQEGLPKSFRTASLVSLMDVSLSMACFLGLGLLLQKIAFLQLILLAGGAIFLFYMSYKLIRDKPQIKARLESINLSFRRVLQTSFILTWFNPHALVDGSILFGTYRASLPTYGITPFLIGMAVASPLWFFSLTSIVGALRTFLPLNFFRILNIICGIFLGAFGLKLAMMFFKALP